MHTDATRPFNSFLSMFACYLFTSESSLTTTSTSASSAVGSSSSAITVAAHRSLDQELLDRGEDVMAESVRPNCQTVEELQNFAWVEAISGGEG